MKLNTYKKFFMCSNLIAIHKKSNFFPISAFEVEFPADVNWIKANLNNTGFYRVNYPKHMWDGLILQLTREHTIFSTADRAQMINDAFSLSM